MADHRYELEDSFAFCVKKNRVALELNANYGIVVHLSAMIPSKISSNASMR